MMAPDGRCKTFDAAADGYVRSEGCALITLRLWSSQPQAQPASEHACLGRCGTDPVLRVRKSVARTCTCTTQVRIAALQCACLHMTQKLRTLADRRVRGCLQEGNVRTARPSKELQRPFCKLPPQTT